MFCIQKWMTDLGQQYPWGELFSQDNDRFTIEDLIIYFPESFQVLAIVVCSRQSAIRKGTLINLAAFEYTG